MYKPIRKILTVHMNQGRVLNDSTTTKNLNCRQIYVIKKFNSKPKKKTFKISF